MNDATTARPASNLTDALLIAAGEQVEGCTCCAITVYADDIVIGDAGVLCPSCATAAALLVLASGEPVAR